MLGLNQYSSEYRTVRNSQGERFNSRFLEENFERNKIKPLNVNCYGVLSWNSIDKADVYCMSPGEKKLSEWNENKPLLEGNLSIEYFCFIRVGVGVCPELETVRGTTPSSRASVTAATLAAASNSFNID